MERLGKNLLDHATAESSSTMSKVATRGSRLQGAGALAAQSHSETARCPWEAWPQDHSGDGLEKTVVGSFVN